MQWSAVTVFGPSIRDYAGAAAPHPELHGCQLRASGLRAACTCAVDESSTCPFSLDADEFGEMALSAGFDIGAPASPPDSAAAVEGQRRAVVAMLRKVSLWALAPGSTPLRATDLTVAAPHSIHRGAR